MKEISGGGGYWWGLDGLGSLYTWGTSIEPLKVRQLLNDPSKSVLEADPNFVPPSVLASKDSNWITRDSEGLHSILPLRFGIKGIQQFANGCVRDRSGDEFCLHQGRQESGWVGPVPPKFAGSYASAGIRISVCRTGTREMRCEYFPTQGGFDGEAEAEAITDLPSDALGLHVGPFTMCAVLDGGKVGCAPVWDLRKGAFGTGTVRFEAEIREPGKVTGLAIAEHDICAIVDGGRVKCWWPPEPFQRDPIPSSDDPRRDVRDVKGVKDVVALAGGAQHMCALISDGTVQCWGMDDMGQLGDGPPFESSKVPVRVLAPVPAEGVE